MSDMMDSGPRAHATHIGRTETRRALIDGGPADRLTAALDYDDPPYVAGDPLPAAWHWLYFHTAPRASLLSGDGRGSAVGLLPAFPGLARMWAGGSFTFDRPIAVGAAIERHSTLASLAEKTGRTGPLVLATLEHTNSDAAGLCVRERHDVVFRQPSQYSGAVEGERPTHAPVWRRELVPDEVLLFCFSALTYNPHRIHYDWRYATEVEGYPALVVHGPLTCILMLDLIRRALPGERLASFDYRAVRPLFCGKRMTVAGRLAVGKPEVEVWAEDEQGFIAMHARATLCR
jgi:3-methylfumaryl-CoA hydratase